MLHGLHHHSYLFGCFLGSTATLGFILGLPLDIRHIAFASANFIHGVFNVYANTGSLPDMGVIIVSFFGVIVIGMINLLVSFSLALITALRARNVKVFEWKYLFGLVASHLVNQPSDFFIPRKQPMKYALIDSDGNIIYDDKPIPKAQKNSKLAKLKLQPKAESTHADSPVLLTPAEKLAKTEKLTESEIAVKKQAIKDKVAEKNSDTTMINDHGHRLPK